MSRRKTKPHQQLEITRPPHKSVSAPALASNSLEHPTKGIPRFDQLAWKALRMAVLLGFPLVFATLGASFVRMETGAIYLWDFATYWGQVLQLTNFLKQGGLFSDVLKAIYQSTSTSDYNFLPSLPLVPFQHLGFDPRTSFIIGIAFLYAGLLYLACVHVHSEYADDSGRIWSGVAGGVVMFASAAIWHPVYRGFVDIIALAAAIGAAALIVKAERSDRRALCYTASGMLMALAPVLRRAFSFLFVVYVVLLSVLWAVELIRGRREWASAWRQGRPKLFFFLGIALVFGVFHGFVVHSLKFNLGIAAAYKSEHSTLEEWRLYLLGYIGLIPVAACVAGVQRLWKYKRLNGTLTVLIVAPILATMLMMRSQSLGEHHRYIFLACFVMILSAALGVAVQYRKDFGSKVFLLLICLSVLGTIRDIQGAGSKGTFLLSNGENPYADTEARSVGWRIFFGYSAPKPIVRTDTAELQRLYSYLDRECSTDPNPRIYILASSIVLGDGVIFSSLYTPPGLQLRSLNKFLPVHQVDLRDGVPNSILQATHIITSDPVQLHLSPSQQKAITVPWEEFRQGRGIARAFERTSEVFHLENEVTAYVYRRTRPTTREDVSELEEDLRKSGLLK